MTRYTWPASRDESLYDGFKQHAAAPLAGTRTPLPEATRARPVAALYVETDGAYLDVPGVDMWDQARDARKLPTVGQVLARQHGEAMRRDREMEGL